MQTQKSSILTKVLCLSLMAFSFWGCEQEYSGTMNINERISLKDKKGRPIDLNVSAFNTKISVNGKMVIVRVPDAKGKMQKVEFVHKQKDPNKDHLIVPASVSGQDFDLEAIRDVQYDTNILSETRESCQECVATREICGYEDGGSSCTEVKECDPQEPTQCAVRNVCRDNPDRWVCHTVCDRYFYGTQLVTQSMTTKTVNGHLLLKKQTNQVVAQFFSQKVSNDYNTRRGVCE